MSDYRVYYVGADRHFKNVEAIDCEDDKSALAKATELAKGKEVHVWQRARCVVIINGREAPGA